MNQKLTVAIAVFAGFAGGVLSQYVSPSPVHAQAPTKVSAQVLDLVDETGAYLGGFMAARGKIFFTLRGSTSDGTMSLHLTDLAEALKVPLSSRPAGK